MTRKIEDNLNIESYIDEYVTLNAESLLSALDSCWSGEKLRDISTVTCGFEREVVMC